MAVPLRKGTAKFNLAEVTYGIRSDRPKPVLVVVGACSPQFGQRFIKSSTTARTRINHQQRHSSQVELNRVADLVVTCAILHKVLRNTELDRIDLLPMFQ